MVVLLAGVLAAFSRDTSGPPHGRVSAAGRSAIPVAADATTTTTVPATTVAAPVTTKVPAPASPTSTRPASPPVTTRPVPTTTAAPAASTPTRSTRANLGIDDPTGVEVPFVAGSTSWSGTTNGITITVRSDKAYPRAGEAIGFDIDLRSPDSPCCNVSFLTGDGYTFTAQAKRGCGGGEPGWVTAHFHTSHTYNLDGRYAFNVMASTGSCTTSGPRANLFGTIEIAPGLTTAQGPSLPHVDVDYSVQPPGHDDDLSWLSLAGLVTEEDGWIRRVSIDWGDGTPPTVFGGAVGSAFNPNVCTSTISGWPVGGLVPIFTGSAIHHYAAPGTYRVTTSALSTACDGVSAPQIGTGTLTWRVPASA